MFTNRLILDIYFSIYGATPLEHINLGASYEHPGEPDAALKECETAAGEVPIAHLYMGNVLFQKKDFERAWTAWQDAIEKTDDPRACKLYVSCRTCTANPDQPPTT